MIRYVLSICFCLLATTAHAAETRDTIITQTITGSDTTAPTAPANLETTPLSISEIQLNWSASTDNVGVTGYHVWRDGSQIATTTLTTYLDTGLATSTSYTYYVTAFDAAGNESASSSPAVVTTLDPTPPSAVGSSSGGYITDGVTIDDVLVEASTNQIVLTFTTNRYVSVAVSWELDGFTLGTVRSLGARKSHEVVIDGLAPNTEYTLTVSAFAIPRFIAGERQLRARTAVLPDTTPPANVSNLQAVRTKDGVALSWQNPGDPDFARVRVVRSTRFYPFDIVDGWVIYDASGEQVLDPFLADTIYYTVFSIDTAGNISSGATIRILDPDQEVAVESDEPITPEIVVPPEFTAPPKEVTAWPVSIAQGDWVSRLGTSSSVSLNANMPFTVQILATAVPPHLKTIIATLYHPDATAGSWQFLLKRTADGSAYAATIGALPVSGQYQLLVQWYDFATKTTGAVGGVLRLSANPTPTTPPPTPPYGRWALIALVALLAVRILHRRMRAGAV